MAKMTKAMFNIKPTFMEMIKAHQQEIVNHQNLIDEFLRRADKVKGEERAICIMEAHRNKEHQRGHAKLINIYNYLNATKDIY